MKITRWMTLAVAAWPLVALAAGEASPFVGKWEWNKALSKPPPGEPPPAGMELEFDRADTLHVHWSVTVIDATGRKTTDTYDLPANGEFYPVDADSTASFQLGANSLKAVFRGPGGESDTMTCTLANANQRMICNGEITSADGKTASYVDVYDRK